MQPKPNRLTKERFTWDNIHDLYNRSGTYYLYECGQPDRPVYVGSSKHLRERLHEYHQKERYDQHPTKKHLRKDDGSSKICSFSVVYRPLDEARRVEREMKRKFKFDYNFK